MLTSDILSILHREQLTVKNMSAKPYELLPNVIKIIKKIQ